MSGSLKHKHWRDPSSTDLAFCNHFLKKFVLVIVHYYPLLPLISCQSILDHTRCFPREFFAVPFAIMALYKCVVLISLTLKTPRATFAAFADPYQFKMKVFL